MKEFWDDAGFKLGLLSCTWKLFIIIIILLVVIKRLTEQFLMELVSNCVKLYTVFALVYTHLKTFSCQISKCMIVSIDCETPQFLPLIQWGNTPDYLFPCNLLLQSLKYLNIIGGGGESPNQVRFTIYFFFSIYLYNTIFCLTFNLFIFSVIFITFCLLLLLSYFILYCNILFG